MVLHFMKTARAHLFAKSEEARLDGEGDDNESEDDSDPATFDPPGVLLDYFRSIKNLEQGGGGTEEKAIRES